MFVFNTTFHVDEALHEEFIEYMLQHFIPMSTQSGLLRSPRLARIFGKEDDEGHSYAMEFTVTDVVTLERWNTDESQAVYAPLLEKFREKLIGFSTIMQTIEY